MAEKRDNYSQIVRRDALTGVGNHVGFFEWLVRPYPEGNFSPFSLMSTELLGLKQLNLNQGREAGDVALRWAASTIKDEARQTTFRLGNEFLTVLTINNPQDQARLAKQISDRLIKEAASVGLNPPPANIAVISFNNQTQCTAENILSAYYGALFYFRQQSDTSFKIFDAAQMKPVGGFLGYVVFHTVSRLTSMPTTLDQAHKLADYDPISDLPNMHAAIEKLHESISQANEAKQPFSILLVDGDTLRQYNKLSFTGGDEMIKRLGEALKTMMRPTDFIARWSSGDQFIIILPNSVSKSAVNVGERMRSQIEKISREWMIHSTISVGIVTYPQHGKTPQQLIEAAEKVLKRAKELGKNRVASL